VERRGLAAASGVQDMAPPPVFMNMPIADQALGPPMRRLTPDRRRRRPGPLRCGKRWCGRAGAASRPPRHGPESLVRLAGRPECCQPGVTACECSPPSWWRSRWPAPGLRARGVPVLGALPAPRQLPLQVPKSIFLPVFIPCSR
jgi:hypothetical protein